MLSACDVASEIRKRVPGADERKVHLLAYYCQAWHVTWAGETMFDGRIEAGPDGPLVPDLGQDNGLSGNHPGDRQIAVLDYVVSRYGHYAADELVTLARSEDPWLDASQRKTRLGGNPEISPEALAAWFSEDKEYVSHQEELGRLRKRRDVYGLKAPAFPEPLEATLRATGRA